MLGEGCGSFGQQIAACARGYIIQYAGKACGIRGCDKRCRHALLSCLVIVGSDQQKRISADLLCIFGQLDSVSGIVGAGARDNGNTTCDALNTILYSCAVLFVGKRGAFTCGADGNDGVDALFNLPIYECAEALEVDTRGGERGDNSRCGSRENSAMVHCFVLLFDLFQIYEVSDTHKKTPR